MTADITWQASATAAGLARLLTEPGQMPAAPGHPAPGQSLATGAAGVALLHVERAKAGLGSWRTAHAWLTCATTGGIDAGARSTLFFGAPAVAFAVGAAADDSGRYNRALSVLDQNVAAAARRRVERAHRRIESRKRPRPSEFDIISGLAGIAACMIRRDPHGNALREVLSYLVRLTEPLPGDRDGLPGWWAGTDPSGRASPALPGGHGNLGMAHGVAGPLAALALGMRHGIVVDGQARAIESICAWLDSWRQGDNGSAWWPEWVTRDEEHAHRTSRTRPSRPSWCYGTPGISRAQQLAGLAINDISRVRMAEASLAGCVADTAQLACLTDPCLCHGWAGLARVVSRAIQDRADPALATHLPHITSELIRRAGHEYRHSAPATAKRAGLLEGAAGIALALHAAAGEIPPGAGWDAFMLIG